LKLLVQINFSNATIEIVRKVHIADSVNRNRGRVIQFGGGRRAAVSGEADGAGAGYDRDTYSIGASAAVAR